jgi:hypothetical protein
MNTAYRSIAVVALLVAMPAVALSAPLSVEVTSDRGPDAVYQSEEVLDLSVRLSSDAYLLLYEIDSEGTVQVIYPGPGMTGLLDGGRTQRIADQFPDQELVVQGPVGQGYVVAIASREPFLDLPWYLRPPNTQGDQLGYAGEPVEEEGVTNEGRVVGDPFVAMERIRRRVVKDNQDPDAFGTAYLSYYVHEKVAYPRYLCEDCHRPGHWSWYDGYDPYYTTCSAVTVRVNWGWYWGPGYWFGSVPYYVYAPAYWPYAYAVPSSGWWCSWDGWASWCSTWPQTVRYKAALPVGYVSPADYDRKYRRGEVGPPPGYLTRTNGATGRRGRDVVVGRNGGNGGGTLAGNRGDVGRNQPSTGRTRTGDLVGRNGRSGSANELGAWRRADPGVGRLTRSAGGDTRGTDLRTQGRQAAGRWRTRLEAGTARGVTRGRSGASNETRGVTRGDMGGSYAPRSTSGGRSGRSYSRGPATSSYESPRWRPEDAPPVDLGSNDAAPVYRNGRGDNSGSAPGFKNSGGNVTQGSADWGRNAGGISQWSGPFGSPQASGGGPASSGGRASTGGGARTHR